MALYEQLQKYLDQMAAAYSAGDAKACAEMFTAQGELHSPYGPAAVGRAAIEALHRDWTAEPSKKKFDLVKAKKSGTMAWALVRFSEGAVTGTGTSLLILEQQDSGAWLTQICCLHGDGE